MGVPAPNARAETGTYVLFTNWSIVVSKRKQHSGSPKERRESYDLWKLWEVMGLGQATGRKPQNLTALKADVWETLAAALPPLLETFGFNRDRNLEQAHRTIPLDARAHTEEELSLVKEYLRRIDQVPEVAAGFTPHAARRHGGCTISLANLALGVMLAESQLQVSAAIHCDHVGLIARLATGEPWYLNRRGGKFVTLREAQTTKPCGGFITYYLEDKFHTQGIYYTLLLETSLKDGAVYHVLSELLGAVNVYQSIKGQPSVPREFAELSSDCLLGTQMLMYRLFPRLRWMMEFPLWKEEAAIFAYREAFEHLLRYSLHQPGTDQPLYHPELTARLLDAYARTPNQILAVLINGKPPPQGVQADLAAYLTAVSQALLAGGPRVWAQLPGKGSQLLYDRSLREAGESYPPSTPPQQPER